MSVESFDPGAQATQLTDAALQRLLELSSALLDEDVQDGTIDRSIVERKMGLTDLEQASMAGLMTAPADSWQSAVEPLQSRQIESLVRFLTLAEEAIGGWQAGDKSPVIALVKVLKSRSSYDRSLTRWIKANSSNRFLPHGSLMDRL